MDLIKMRLFIRHHCTTKVKKTRPYSNLDSRNKRKAFGQNWGRISRRRVPSRRTIL